MAGEATVLADGSFMMWATFAIIVATITAYALEKWSIEAVSLVAVAAFLLLFSLDMSDQAPTPAELVAGFANPALVSVLCLLIVGQALFQTDALDGCQVLYAKAWGATADSAPPDDPALAEWMPRLSHFDRADPAAVFMHCLPVRRDVEIAAEVLDSRRSRVVSQAGNRLYVQMALLAWLFEQ